MAQGMRAIQGLHKSCSITAYSTTELILILLFFSINLYSLLYIAAPPYTHAASVQRKTYDDYLTILQSLPYRSL